MLANSSEVKGRLSSQFALVLFRVMWVVSSHLLPPLPPLSLDVYLLWQLLLFNFSRRFRCLLVNWTVALVLQIDVLFSWLFSLVSAPEYEAQQVLKPGVNTKIPLLLFMWAADGKQGTKSKMDNCDNQMALSVCAVLLRITRLHITSLLSHRLKCGR